MNPNLQELIGYGVEKSQAKNNYTLKHREKKIRVKLPKNRMKNKNEDQTNDEEAGCDFSEIEFQSIHLDTDKKRQNMVQSALRIHGINYKNDETLTPGNATPMSNKSSFFEKENHRYGNVPNNADLNLP